MGPHPADRSAPKPGYTLERPPFNQRPGSDRLVTAMEKVKVWPGQADAGLTDFEMSSERLMMSTQLRL
jgi:hypothetical protein